jgi:hypothetical protein
MCLSYLCSILLQIASGCALLILEMNSLAVCNTIFVFLPCFFYKLTFSSMSPKSQMQKIQIDTCTIILHNIQLFNEPGYKSNCSTNCLDHGPFILLPTSTAFACTMHTIGMLLFSKRQGLILST